MNEEQARQLGYSGTGPGAAERDYGRILHNAIAARWGQDAPLDDDADYTALSNGAMEGWHRVAADFAAFVLADHAADPGAAGLTWSRRDRVAAAAKRIAKDAKPYRELKHVTEKVGAEIWCLVGRDDIERLKDALASPDASAGMEKEEER